LRPEVEELSDLLRESIFEFIVSRVFIDYHMLVLVIGRMCAAIDFTSYIVHGGWYAWKTDGWHPWTAIL